MKTYRVALLAITLVTGCLDPMVSDAAGYSTNLLSADAAVPRASADVSLARRIDANDGIASKSAALKKAFADGEDVSYWDLGIAKSAMVPAYQLVACNADGVPEVDGDIGQPLVLDSAPGDADYTQLWAVMPVCITRYYDGQHVISAAALDDAIELELVHEAGMATRFIHAPIVPDDVTLASLEDHKLAGYYRGFELSLVDFGAAGDLHLEDGKLTTPNVYEIMVPGAKTPARLVFGVGPVSPRYAPIWTQYTVVVSETLDLDTLRSETDLVTFGDDKSMKPASSSIIAVFATGSKVARPLSGAGAQP